MTIGGTCHCGSTMTAQVGRSMVTGESILWWTCDDYPDRHGTDSMFLPSALADTVLGVIRRDDPGLQHPAVARASAHQLSR